MFILKHHTDLKHYLEIPSLSVEICSPQRFNNSHEAIKTSQQVFKQGMMVVLTHA